MNGRGKEGGEEEEGLPEVQKLGKSHPQPSQESRGKVARGRGKSTPEGGRMGGWGQGQHDWRHFPAPGAAPLSPTFFSSNLDGTRPNHQCGFH